MSNQASPTAPYMCSDSSCMNYAAFKINIITNLGPTSQNVKEALYCVFHYREYCRAKDKELTARLEIGNK